MDSASEQPGEAGYVTRRDPTRLDDTRWKFPSRGSPWFCTANSYVYLGNRRVPERESNTIIRGFLNSLGEKSEEQPTKRRKGKERETKKDGTRSLVELLRSWGPGARERGRRRVDEQVLRSLEKWVSHRFRVIPGPTVHQKRSLTCVKTSREQILLL